MRHDDAAQRILIMVDDADLARRWAHWLSPVADVRCCREQDDPQIHHAAVIATPSAAAKRRHAVGLTRGASGGAGLIVVGPPLPAADVSLPEDVTERELSLAARLLLRIVQLSRQHHRVEAERRSLDRIARIDPLTELANRRAWDGRLNEILSATERDVCLTIIDLDHFKRVNDVRGHAAGDDVLRRAAARLRGAVRRRDLVARLGGDEFGLLLIDVDPRSAAVVVDRARRAIADRSRADAVTVTASAGSVLRPAGAGSDGPTLYRQASVALQQAKGTGRDRAVGP